MKNLIHFPENMSSQARSAFLISTLIAIAHFAVAPFYFYLLQTTHLTPFGVLTIITSVLGALFMVSVMLIWKGRSTAGIILMLGILAISYPLISVFLISGLGLVLGLALMVSGPLIAFQTLPPKPGQVMTVLTALAGIITMLLDILSPAPRPTLQGIVIQIIAGIVVTILGYLIVRQFRNYSIRTKLLVLFGSYLLALVVLGIFSYRNISSQNAQLDSIYENDLRGAVYLANAESALWQLRYGFPQFLVLEDPAAKEQIIADESKWYQVIDENMKAYEALSLTPEELELLQHWNNIFSNYVAARPRWFELQLQGKTQEAAEWRAQTTTPYGRDAVETIGQLIELQRAAADQKHIEATTQARNAALVMVGLTGVALVIGLVGGFFAAQSLYTPIDHLTEVSTQISGGNLEARAMVASKDEIGVLANSFNEMASQLQGTLRGLEQRVAERTKALETVAEVGTATATILESRRLLQEVVDLTKERFNLYHSHIYLLDETGENLVLASGAGEPGRQMMKEGRSIPLSREQSLVARAAREKQGVTVNDVTQAPDFLPNPLLPDTRSELAVPMIVGGNVIGVFDIQSNQVGRFTDADINIQTTLAAQLATSIQNVRTFEKAGQQAELESLVNAIGQKIQRAVSIEDTLQTVAREMGLALGASRVSVSIGDTPDRNADASRN